MPRLPWLRERSLRSLRPGSPEFFTRQKAFILDRPLVKRCYDDWYARQLGDARSVPQTGVMLELGSGGGYLKDLEPAIVTSDVVAHVADRVIDGRSLPFADNSVQALFLTHTFHHIPDVAAFLKEAQRALVPGGVISMIEVAHTPFARFFFKILHHEPYDDRCREWSFAQKDSMMDCNQALSWVVLVRDRAGFERRFPALQIERLTLIPGWLTYFLSGGVTSPYLIPNFMNRCLIGLENLLKPVAPLFALHWHICVRKKNTP
jgi:SAM-dependent methyltransferase